MGPRAETPAMAEFGRRVRVVRQDRAWSLETLGERSGLHWTYIGQVERGRRNISLLNIVRLAQALEVNPGELLDGLGATALE